MLSRPTGHNDDFRMLAAAIAAVTMASSRDYSRDFRMDYWMVALSLDSPKAD